MNRTFVTIAGAIVLIVGASAGARGQWDKLKVPGFGSQPANGKSPTAYLVLATVSFLAGGERLLESTGHAKEAAKCRALKDNVEKQGPSKENLGQVNEVGSQLNEIAKNKKDLDKADTKAVTDAAVKVGVATYLEKKAADGARGAVSAGGAGNASELAVFSSVVPKNLETMLSVQSALFNYLKVKGVDPSPSVKSEIDKIEKA